LFFLFFSTRSSSMKNDMHFEFYRGQGGGDGDQPVGGVSRLVPGSWLCSALCSWLRNWALGRQRGD
jgi:hypothetical protein